MQETQDTQVQSLGQEDPLEEGMANHSSTLAWRIPWTEDPGRLQFIDSYRVRHDWNDLACDEHGSPQIRTQMRRQFRGVSLSGSRRQSEYKNLDVLDILTKDIPRQKELEEQVQNRIALEPGESRVWKSWGEERGFLGLLSDEEWDQPRFFGLSRRAVLSLFPEKAQGTVIAFAF